MGKLLRDLKTASQRYYRHVGQWPATTGQLLTDPGVRYWQGPYLKPTGLALAQQRFPRWQTQVETLTGDAGTPPPPCPTDPGVVCRRVPWLVLRGLPPAPQAALEKWLDTEPAPQTGNVRLVEGVLFYRLD